MAKHKKANSASDSGGIYPVFRLRNCTKHDGSARNRLDYLGLPLIGFDYRRLHALLRKDVELMMRFWLRAAAGPPKPGIKNVPQRVSQHVDGEHGDADGDAWSYYKPRRNLDIPLG